MKPIGSREAALRAQREAAQTKATPRLRAPRAANKRRKYKKKAG